MASLHKNYFTALGENQSVGKIAELILGKCGQNKSVREASCYRIAQAKKY